MAQYFARIENGIVQEVIVTDQATLNSGIFGDPTTFVETFYDASQRTKYAGIGDTYYPDLDAFIGQQPYPSWSIDKTLKKYVAPVSKPIVDKTQIAYWNEKTLSWDIVANPYLNTVI